MTENVSQKLDKVIKIDEEKIHQHLGELVRGTVEETLKLMFISERPPEKTNAATSVQIPFSAFDMISDQ